MEHCQQPGLAIRLTLRHDSKSDDSSMVSSLVAFVSGLLLDNDANVRNWFANFVRIGQKVATSFVFAILNIICKLGIPSLFLLPAMVIFGTQRVDYKCLSSQPWQKRKQILCCVPVFLKKCKFLFHHSTINNYWKHLCGNFFNDASSCNCSWWQVLHCEWRLTFSTTYCLLPLCILHWR